MVSISLQDEARDKTTEWMKLEMKITVVRSLNWQNSDLTLKSDRVTDGEVLDSDIFP